MTQIHMLTLKTPLKLLVLVNNNDNIKKSMRKFGAKNHVTKICDKNR